MRVRSTERKRTYEHRREVLRRRGKRRGVSQRLRTSCLGKDGKDGTEYLIASLHPRRCAPTAR